MDGDTPTPQDLSANIARKMGFDGMTKEEQEVMIDRVGALVLKNVFAKCMEAMGEHDASELSLLIDSGAAEIDILLFLRDRVPNFEEIAQAEAERFRAGVLTALGQQGNDE